MKRRCGDTPSLNATPSLSVINNIAWNNKNYALEKAAEALSHRGRTA
jgi:hypothetical protein